MGRNKNTKQNSSSTDNGNFENPDSMSVDEVTIGEITINEAGASSNLPNDRTSADYYFDSYSHFGIKFHPFSSAIFIILRPFCCMFVDLILISGFFVAVFLVPCCVFAD